MRRMRLPEEDIYTHLHVCPIPYTSAGIFSRLLTYLFLIIYVDRYIWHPLATSRFIYNFFLHMLGVWVSRNASLHYFHVQA